MQLPEECSAINIYLFKNNAVFAQQNIFGEFLAAVLLNVTSKQPPVNLLNRDRQSKFLSATLNRTNEHLEIF